MDKEGAPLSESIISHIIRGRAPLVVERTEKQGAAPPARWLELAEKLGRRPRGK